MLERYPKEVKLVAKNFPLARHKFATKAAMAALAANAQGKFWEFHSKLFENYKVINDAKIQDIAGELGLDMDGNFIKANSDQETNVPGIFAAGDVTGRTLQIAVAVGDGYVAAESAYAHIKKKEGGIAPGTRSYK